MSTIYLNQHGTTVSKDGGRFVIKSKEGMVRHIPASYAECFVVMANVQITHAVIIEILCNGGSIIYLGSDGEILGELGKRTGRCRQLVRQLSCYMDLGKRQKLASYIVRKKITAQRNLLSVKNKQIKSLEMKAAISKLSGLLKNVDENRSVDKLMGMEGICAKTYFDAFSALLENTEFVWSGRKRRPAPDAVNSMLNFGYSLLEKDVRRAIAVAGLAEGIGFLHELDYRKDSFVYDVMEIFRADIVDRLVLKCINLHIITKDDFLVNDGRCLFNDEGRKRFISVYEQIVGEVDEEGETSKLKQIEYEVRWLAKRIRELCDAEPSSK